VSTVPSGLSRPPHGQVVTSVEKERASYCTWCRSRGGGW
jgi:hypothetical protein